MRILLALMVAVVPAAAQVPSVSLVNATRPGSDFTVGDRFEIAITAAPNQYVSIRTSRQGSTDWSPIVGWTDSSGRWSARGQFEKNDFGGWREMWTVGGKLASPVIEFLVNAPCLTSGQNFIFTSGPNEVMHCETAEGMQIFATPSLSDTFRTPDGRLVSGRGNDKTQEQYFGEILENAMAIGMGSTPIALVSSRGGLGDETATVISNLIGANALSEIEVRNLLPILQAAFERPDGIQPSAKEPIKTLLLLRHLDDLTGAGDLKQEIDKAITYFQAR